MDLRFGCRVRRAAACAAAVLPATLFLASCQTTPTGPGATVGDVAGSVQPGAEGKFETPRKPEGELTIQIITNGISPFWDPMGVGMKKAAEEFGINAEWSGPQNSEVGAQKQMVESALAKNVDGIALSCIEPEASIPIIQAVIDRGIPIITFDSDSPKSARLIYIGTNNVNAGKAAGEFAVKLLPNGGKFMGFVGNISAANARERRDGFVEASKDHGITLVDVLDDNKDPARARRNVEDTITKSGDDLQGLLGLFSYNGPAIVQAMQSQPGLRAKFKIIAFDAEPVTLEKLESGDIDGTVVQKPYDFGYLSTKFLYLVNRKGLSEAKKEMNIPADNLYDTGVEVVTPATVKAYKEGLAKLGIKSS